MVLGVQLSQQCQNDIQRISSADADLVVVLEWKKLVHARKRKLGTVLHATSDSIFERVNAGLFNRLAEENRKEMRVDFAVLRVCSKQSAERREAVQCPATNVMRGGDSNHINLNLALNWDIGS